MTAGNLPGKLPNGMTFTSGVNVQILNEGQVMQDLPEGAGIQLDFPISADQYAVLYWDGSKWIEITQTAGEDQVSGLVNTNSANELYLLESSEEAFYKVLTTEKTGVFVLVKK